MDRKAHQEQHRRRLGITILVSVAAHVALLAWVTVDVPGIEKAERTRVTQLIELADAWQDQPLEVVQLRDQAADRGAPTSTGENEVGGATLDVKPVSPGALTLTASLSLTPVESVARPTVVFASTRGVVKRRGGGAQYRDAEFDFEPASAAAREAERRRGGTIGAGGSSGSGGIGVTIRGGIGGDCATPLGGAPNGSLINRVVPGRRIP